MTAETSQVQPAGKNKLGARISRNSESWLPIVGPARSWPDDDDDDDGPRGHRAPVLSGPRGHKAPVLSGPRGHRAPVLSGPRAIGPPF